MSTIAASEGQMEVLEALVAAGTIREAALSLGIPESAVERRLQRLRDRTELTTTQLAFAYGQRRIRVVRYRQLRLWETAL